MLNGRNMSICGIRRWIPSIVFLIFVSTHNRPFGRVESFSTISSTTSSSTLFRRIIYDLPPGNIHQCRHKIYNHENSRKVRTQRIQMSESDNEDALIWNPIVRKYMSVLAAFGAIETIYLSVSELIGRPNSELLFCSSSNTGGELGGVSSCNSVLSGQYSHIPGTEIPLAVVGAMSYLLVFTLAVLPLLQRRVNPSVSEAQSSGSIQTNDGTNRVLLLATTTTMATFSIFLMSILLNVLHQSCIYCVTSAVCSVSLATLAWFGGALPKTLQREGMSLSTAGGILSTFAAILLYVNSDGSTTIYTYPNNSMAQTLNPTTSTLLATSESGIRNNIPSLTTSKEPPLLLVDQEAPEITTESSVTALQLAAELQKLNTKFYGAYWCSHCYDQKQALGKQAMARIPYVECSREGKNEQAALCKEKKIPGYPTWEISGKLYPGERALDEIQEIVASIKTNQ